MRLSAGAVRAAASAPCAGGSWSLNNFNASTLPDGDVTITVSQYDLAGNLAQVTGAGVKDTLPPGADEPVRIGITTNRGGRNYKVRPSRGSDIELEDGQTYLGYTQLFTDSNFPTFHISCPSCATGGAVLMDGKIKKDRVVIPRCSRFFVESTCTASFNSANLRLKEQVQTGNNANWQIDISFLKDPAGNSPPSDTWQVFDLLNLPPVIIVR